MFTHKHTELCQYEVSFYYSYVLWYTKCEAACMHAYMAKWFGHQTSCCFPSEVKLETLL